ncbi:MAG: gluconeogenesis factor YvcK family protein [Myxococcota bacterium]
MATSARRPARAIAVIGGGTGSFHVLSGLRHHPELEINSIVTMMDSGGDSGRLRDEFGVLPPGDLRRCLIALSDESKLLRELFAFRFEEEPLSGRSFGNLFLLALGRMLGSEKEAVDAIGRLLQIHGRVLPVTWDHAHLIAELADGSTLEGEGTIDGVAADQAVPIERVRLHPKAAANPDALRVLTRSDAIVLAPGSLFTSTLPNLLVEGIREAIDQAEAPLVYVLNLMTRQNETPGYSAVRHVEEIARYAGRVPDIVLAHGGEISEERMRRYEAEDARPVDVDVAGLEALGVRDVRIAPLVSPPPLVRHDPTTTAEAIVAALDAWDARSSNDV